MLVGYWDIRARVEPIHLMLEYLGIDYERKSYKLPNLGLSSKEKYKELEWFQQKWNMGMDHPNIPYIIDGEVKVSQTMAIMKYIARKAGRELIPKTQTEIMNCDMAEGAVLDLWHPFIMMCYKPDYKDMRVKYMENLPNTFGPLERVLGLRKWLGGDNLTYIDFQLNEILDHMELNCETIFDQFPNIKKYKAAFFSLNKIKAYRETSRFKKWPLYARAAQWGGQDEEGQMEDMTKGKDIAPDFLS